MQGITFSVSSPNRGSVNTLRIVPSGKIAARKPIVKTIDGTVTGAEIADLDGDGWPEPLLFITSDGDSNAQPTGGTRQIRYRLVPGEATPVRKVLRK